MPAFVRYEAVLQNKSARTISWAAHDENHAPESARQYRQYQGRTTEMQVLLHSPRGRRKNVRSLLAPAQSKKRLNESRRSDQSTQCSTASKRRREHINSALLASQHRPT
ncbi:hypothetical protein L1887_61843 [Cichorium endivia]|nr:hypothetical protein L1887_61843 [Cichorium endivia]